MARKGFKIIAIVVFETARLHKRSGTLIRTIELQRTSVCIIRTKQKDKFKEFC